MITITITLPDFEPENLAAKMVEDARCDLLESGGASYSTDVLEIAARGLVMLGATAAGSTRPITAALAVSCIASAIQYRLGGELGALGPLDTAIRSSHPPGC